MLKIHHFANSFISVESGNSILSCDPWIGKTSDNAWYSYPIKKLSEIDKRIYNSNFIYISHLHCDHFNERTLRKFKNKKLTFIIKKFDNGHLKKKLEKFTKNKILELESFKKVKINKDFSVSIIPQIISNESDLPDNIQYDIDTSIVIQSNHDKSIFYNNVDMPINIKVLKKINNHIKKNYKNNIDIFCCALGAASEFPQSFLNLNKVLEKKRIIDDSLKKLRSYIDYLKPKVFFPAGGTYTIYGKYHQLNKYIAQPSFDQILKTLKKYNIKTFNLIGGNTLTYNKKSKLPLIKKVDLKSLPNIQKFINQTKNLNYYYNNQINKKINLKKLDVDFMIAKKNYFKILSKLKIDTFWDIKFNIYKNLEINENCKINTNKSNLIKKYYLKNYTKKPEKKFYLECFLEFELFKSLLHKKFPWNTSLSGSTILFKRNPNVYNVDMVFSLNFLRV